MYIVSETNNYFTIKMDSHLNSSAPQTTQLYVPLSLWCVNSPVKALRDQVFRHLQHVNKILYLNRFRVSLSIELLLQRDSLRAGSSQLTPSDNINETGKKTFICHRDALIPKPILVLRIPNTGICAFLLMEMVHNGTMVNSSDELLPI